jgi:hypothetical protein
VRKHHEGDQVSFIQGRRALRFFNLNFSTRGIPAIKPAGSSFAIASVNSTDKTGRVKLRYRVKPLRSLLGRIRMMAGKARGVMAANASFGS